MSFEPVDFEPPTLSKSQIANGIPVYHYAEPEVPLVTVLVRIHAGMVNDPPGKTGLAGMTAQVMRNGGSKSLPGDELDRQLESRGALLTVESSREETWFRLSILPEDLEWGMGVLSDMLTSPAFPEEKLEEARGRALVALQQRLDVPRDIAGALFPQLIYGKGNAWGTTETDRSLSALTVEDLRDFYEQFYHTQTLSLGASGDLTADQFIALAQQNFGTIPQRPDFEMALPEVKPIEHTRVVIVERPVSQNVIYFGHEGVGRFPELKFPIKLFNSVLAGGFTSRLFKEVRSNRGLAYSVWGRLGEGTEKGLYYNVAMTKTGSTSETLNLMLDINRELTRTPPTVAEVELARQSDVNSFVFFFDTAEKIVRQRMYLDAFGYPEDYLATYVDRLREVTAEEIRQAASTHLHLERIVVLVVGSVDDPLRTELEKIGPIEVISEEALRTDWL